MHTRPNERDYDDKYIMGGAHKFTMGGTLPLDMLKS